MKIEGHRAILDAAVKALHAGLLRRGVDPSTVDLRPLLVGNWLDDVLQVHGFSLEASKTANGIAKGVSNLLFAPIQAAIKVLGDSATLGSVVAYLLERVAPKVGWSSIVTEALKAGEEEANKCIRNAVEQIRKDVDELRKVAYQSTGQPPPSLPKVTDFTRSGVTRWIAELQRTIDMPYGTPVGNVREELGVALSRINVRLKDIVDCLSDLELVKGDVKEFLALQKCSVDNLIDLVVPDNVADFNVLAEFINSAIAVYGYFHFASSPETMDDSRTKSESAKQSLNANWVKQYRAILCRRLYKKPKYKEECERLLKRRNVAPQPVDQMLQQAATPWHYYSYSFAHLDRADGGKNDKGQNCVPVGTAPAATGSNGVTPQNDNCRWATTHGDDDRRLYRYLEEDLQIMGGRIYNLEKEWAEPFFIHSDRTIPSRRSSDPDEWFDWVIGLAELGSILHTAEDFFAHSTFVENAIPHALPEKLDLVMQSKNLRAVYGRRLRKWECNGKAGQQLADDYVATGFFDTPDVLLSLLEVFFEKTGLQLRVPFTRVGVELSNPNVELMEFAEEVIRWWNDPKAQILDTCWDIGDVFASPERAFADTDNEIAQEIKKVLAKYDVLSQDRRFRITNEERIAIRKLVRDTNIFSAHAFAEEITNVVVFTVNAMRSAQTVFRWIGLLIDLVQYAARLNKSIAIAYVRSKGKFARYVAELVVFRPLAEAVLDKLLDELGDHVSYYLTDAVIKVFGGRAVGSHSLIAKDDHHALFYEEAVKLAMAVDWHIVRHLTRSDMADIDDASDEPTYRNWNFLINEVFRHPRTRPDEKDVGETEPIYEPVIGDVEVVTDTKATLDALQKRFVRTANKRAMRDAGYGRGPFWWAIVDRNLWTYGVDNRDREAAIAAEIGLFEEHQGGLPANRVPVIKRRLKKGLRLMIPFQPIGQVPIDAAPATRVWWSDVLRLDLKTLQQAMAIPTGFTSDDSEAEIREAIAGMQFLKDSLTPPPTVNGNEALQVIEAAEKLQQFRQRHQLECADLLRGKRHPTPTTEPEDHCPPPLRPLRLTSAIRVV